jgi:hypothetical protein
MNKHTAIKALAGFMGVYHVVMGLAGIWSGDIAASAAYTLWHARVHVDPQFSYLAKFLGAYVIAFGGMMLAIAKDPVRYGPLVYVAALLGAIRIVERLVFASELEQAFGIGMDRTIATSVIVLALNGGLILLKPKAPYTAAAA